MLETSVWLFEKVNRFPKSQRFVLGQQIEISTLRSQRLIIEANFAKGSDATKQKLYELNVELEVLRSLVRMAVEMNFMKIRSGQYITLKIDEVGRMSGAWAKKLK